MGFLELAGITGPITVVVLVGYASVRWGVIAKPGVGALAKFVITFALPFALFRVLSSQEFSQIANLNYLFGVAIGSGLTFLIGLFTGLIWARAGLTGAALFGMGSAMSNGIMIGIPVTVLIFGEIGPVAVAIMLLVQSSMLMPLAVSLCDFGQAEGRDKRAIALSALTQAARNPLIMAIVLGFVFAVFEIQTPALLSNAVDLFAATAAGLGLFVIGGLLVGAPMSGFNGQITTILCFKLVLHPVLMFLAMYWMPGVDPVWKTVAVIMASLPMIGVYPALAARYGMGQTAAAVALPTTIVSLFTATAIIWALLNWQPFGELIY